MVVPFTVEMVRALSIAFIVAFSSTGLLYAHDHDHGPKPVHFIANQGQWGKPFLYKATVAGATAFLEKDGITWVKLQENADEIMHDIAQASLDEREALQLSGHAWRMRFHGGAMDPVISASGSAPFTHNYILGNDPTLWRSKIPVMGEITYHEVWPGIDVVIKGTENGNLKYDMVLRPGADASLIAFSFEGLDGMHTSPEGELILPTTVGEVRELAPVAYYGDDKTTIPCTFELREGRLTFALGDHDASRTIIIDPELIAATYSGATGPSNYGHCATYDDEGNVYSGARSFGPGYPTTLGAFQMDFGGGYVDISLSKLSPDGSTLIYATYLGGDGAEYPHSMIVDQQGRLCVLGSTTSNDYPVSADAVQPGYGGSTDMIITVLTPDGTGLQGSTYLGGANSDGSNAMYSNYGEEFRGEIMLVDGNGNVLVASFSRSPDFPVTPNAYQSTLSGMQDAVVLSIDNTCSNLLWSTFLGGAQNDGAFGIRVVGDEVYVCGQTHSTDMQTTPGAYQTTNQGGQDGFVVRLGNNGSQLLSSTYFGTSSADRPYFLDTDSDNNIWIYGQSVGAIPIQPAGIYGDAGGTIFLAKMNADLSDVLLSTKIGPGSSPVMTPVAFLVDHCDKIYVSGYGAGWSNLPVTANSLYSSGSFYLAAFDVDMSDMVFATYYGGNHVDGGTSRFDKNGIVYQGVCSSGNSMQTTPWAHATTQMISWDIGVFKIDFQVAGVTAAGASPVNQGCAPIEIQFSNTSTGTDWLWNFGDGSDPVAAFEPSHLYTEAGDYTITLIASDSMACNLADTTTFQIEIGLAEPYIASFTTDQDPGCTVTEVAFTNTSTGSLLEFLWDMGDGTQYTDTNVVHTYADPGSYDVQLNILDPTGCSQPDSVVQTIQVVLDPVLVEAIAEIAPPGPCELTVTTTNSSTGVDPTFEWNMGDGTVLTDAVIEHTYAQPGEYTILFIASDPATCNMADTLTWEVEIQGSAQAILDFETEIQQLCASGTVETVNLSTGPVLEYSWNMGDGNTYDQFEVSHLYEEPGMYTIELSATDPNGCAAPMPFYASIYVAEPEPISAGFSAEVESSCAGTQLNATNFSQGEDLIYHWSFGDGSTSNEENVEHLYVEPGEVILQLIVEDANGCTPNDTLQQVMFILAAPMVDASFDHTLSDNCIGGQFSGQALNVGTLEHTWDMGEGTILNGSYVDHQYTEAGQYEITLIVSDADCGNDTAYTTIDVVLPVPMDLSFDLQQVDECGQTSVVCSNTSTGNNLNYVWWTSDNFSYYGPEMEHTFTEPGTYEIRFYGLDPLGCTGPDSLVVDIVVEPVEPFTAEFDLSSDMDCNGTTVQAGTNNTSADLTYSWLIGDGSTYADPDVTHVFTTPGTYSVELTVVDDTGCNEPLTWSQEIEVLEPTFLDAGLQMESTASCGTMEVMLLNTSLGSPAEMLWDMGNGQILSGEAVAYTYDEPGTYIITLTINDPESCNLTDSQTTSITVEPLLPFDASFDLDQEGDCGEVQVNCVNTSTGSGVEQIWIMGDGTTFTSNDATHSYTTPGTYNIQLILSDPTGCQAADTAMAEIVVAEPMPIVIDMTVEQSGDCSTMQVQSMNNTAGSQLQWFWDMGDGSQYDTYDATHVYAEPGTYNVSLLVSDTVCGQQESQVLTVSVANGIPDVQLSSPVLCPGESVTLDASATPGIYSWNNGSTDHSITVDQPGVYTVTVDGVDGCTGTAIVEVFSGQDFTFEETIQACPNETVPLTVPVDGMAYTWSTGGIQQTEHVRGAGTYSFVVMDNDGCQHTGSYIVEALDAEAQLFAPNAFTPDGDGINDVFTIQGYGDEASRFAVYNRWGELLYETKESPPVWDGMFNGSFVKQDVYVYQLEYRSVCSNAIVNTMGHVTVIK